jgi:hypothetical protein
LTPVVHSETTFGEQLCSHASVTTNEVFTAKLSRGFRRPSMWRYRSASPLGRGGRWAVGCRASRPTRASWRQSRRPEAITTRVGKLAARTIPFKSEQRAEERFTFVHEEKSASAMNLRFMGVSIVAGSTASAVASRGSSGLLVGSHIHRRELLDIHKHEEVDVHSKHTRCWRPSDVSRPCSSRTPPSPASLTAWLAVIHEAPALMTHAYHSARPPLQSVPASRLTTATGSPSAPLS